MSKKPIRLNSVVLASHLVFMGYGHWLPNDLRGSGSLEVRKPDLDDLGDIHFGRKEDQPTRDELRRFFRKTEARLDHPVLWYDEEKRNKIACAFAEVTKQRGYTIWACAILRNHAHLVIRTHKTDNSETMWQRLADASGHAMRTFADVDDKHPIWSNRPYKVFLKSRPSALARIGYVERNPEKERLARQRWEFVSACPWL